MPVISSLSLVLVSDITSKCQNLFPLQTSLSQNMATLMFQLFRLKTLEISLTPLFLSHPAANLSPVDQQLYLFSVLDYAKQHCYGYSCICTFPHVCMSLSHTQTHTYMWLQGHTCYTCTTSILLVCQSHSGDKPHSNLNMDYSMLKN